MNLKLWVSPAITLNGILNTWLNYFPLFKFNRRIYFITFHYWCIWCSKTPIVFWCQLSYCLDLYISMSQHYQKKMLKYKLDLRPANLFFKFFLQPSLPCLGPCASYPVTVARHMISLHKNCCSSGTFNAERLMFRLSQCGQQSSSLY